MPAIGIDLGTTNCCVAAFHYGKVQIFQNDMGHRTMPSCVAFTKAERLIGLPAKDQITTNNENTIYGIKRLIGRKCNDPKVIQDVENWPFNVVDDSGKPLLNVVFKGDESMFTPEQISAMLLEKMKEVAEIGIGEDVVEAVITVPAYFNNAQKQATKDAGVIAGLSVLRIIPEPTAAALAYGLEKNIHGKALIFDLGGGTFDVAILKIGDDSNFETLAVAGDTHLGGVDFDTKLVNYCVREFKRQNSKDLSSNLRALGRLRAAAENAKHMLSCSTEYTIFVHALHEGIDFSTTITRARFEDMCRELFAKTIEIVQSALEDAKLTKNDIDDIVLIGGSTRIPRVQKMLQTFFEGKALKCSINPDEAVAYGAAIQAALLCGDKSKEIKDYLITDVVPISLGIELRASEMVVLIERNSKVPCKQTKKFSTSYDNQTKLDINVFEGEHGKTAFNHLLGTFTLEGIPKAKKRTLDVQVTFDLDLNGILKVTAQEMSKGKTKSITVKQNKGRLSKAEIDRMMEEGKKYVLADKLYKQKNKARNDLTAYVYKTMDTLELAADNVGQEQRLEALSHCKETLEWIDNTFNLALLEQYGEKKKALEKNCNQALTMAKRPRGAYTCIANVD